MRKILSTKYNENSFAFGLLLIRVGAGGLMLTHGFDKMLNYAENKSMNYLFGAPFDGVLVIFAELFCSLFLIFGLFTRFALIPLIVTMIVAFFIAHDGIVIGKSNGQSALLYLLVYSGLLFTGPGKFSIDRMIAK